MSAETVSRIRDRYTNVQLKVSMNGGYNITTILPLTHLLTTVDLFDWEGTDKANRSLLELRRVQHLCIRESLLPFMYLSHALHNLKHLDHKYSHGSKSSKVFLGLLSSSTGQQESLQLYNSFDTDNYSLIRLFSELIMTNHMLRCVKITIPQRRQNIASIV